MAKLGLDGHDRGAKVVAHALRDAGFEVVYTGVRRTPHEVVSIAIDEDIDVIGLSILSGAHMALCRDVLDDLTRRDARDDVPVVVGGTIGPGDAEALRAMGVAEVFPVKSPLDQLARRIKALVHDR